MALRKLFRAPPRSPPSVLSRLVPNTSTTIARMIRSCQMLIPPSPMPFLHGKPKFPMIRQRVDAAPSVLRRNLQPERDRPLIRQGDIHRSSESSSSRRNSERFDFDY